MSKLFELLENMNQSNLIAKYPKGMLIELSNCLIVKYWKDRINTVPIE